MKAHRRQWTDMANTLFDKVWDTHEIAELPGGVRLLHIDRHWLHELTGVAAMEQVEQRGVPIRNPELTFATLDHVISTRPGRTAGDENWSTAMVEALRERTARANIRRFDVVDRRQGIVHVIGPELGLTLPGLSIVCGDSHTCTHGAFRSEEHTSELQSLMRISYAVFCLKQKNKDRESTEIQHN